VLIVLIEYRFQWVIDICASHVGLKLRHLVFAECNIIIGNIKWFFLLEVLEVASKTHDGEFLSIWKTLQEKLHRFFCDVVLSSHHGATSVADEVEAVLVFTFFDLLIDFSLFNFFTIILIQNFLWGSGSVFRFLSIKGWQELGHQGNITWVFGVAFLHEELWLVHICSLVKDLDVFLEIIKEASNLLNDDVVLGLFHDLTVWWMTDI